MDRSAEDRLGEAYAAAVTYARWPSSTLRRQVEADRRLVDLLRRQGFTGRDYDVFAHALVRQGMAYLGAMAQSRLIFRLCAQRGRQLHAEADWKEPDRDVVVNDALWEALTSFRRLALVGGGWDPARGRTLAHLFTAGFCVGAFPNAYRRWLAEQRPTAAEFDPERHTVAVEGPEDLLVRREEVRDGLAGLDVRTAFVVFLQAEGHTHREIGAMLADGTTDRAVEAILRRHRHRATRQSSANGRREEG